MEETRLAEMINRAQQRDPRAFDALVEAYSSRLYGYFYRFTGSRPDAEDLLQDLFVRLVRMIGQYEHEGRFDSWLFRIAGNLVRDRLRRRQTAHRAGLGRPSGGTGDETADPLIQYPDPSAGQPGDRLQMAEETNRLQRAIDRLPEHEREVILLRHFSRMAFKEIAEVLEVPLGTVLARGHRGLGRLRELMEENTDA
ncbi:MAG: RNA polymerase sigma factor [Phycisphaerales bacterium]|nr:RNA polymerase sigma factor [Phycisphaerales bacterium]